MYCDLWPKVVQDWIVDRSTARNFTVFTYALLFNFSDDIIHLQVKWRLLWDFKSGMISKWSLKNPNIFACGLNRFLFLKLILFKRQKSLNLLCKSFFGIIKTHKKGVPINSFV